MQTQIPKYLHVEITLDPNRHDTKVAEEICQNHLKAFAVKTTFIKKSGVRHPMVRRVVSNRDPDPSVVSERLVTHTDTHETVKAGPMGFMTTLQGALKSQKWS